MIQELSRFEKDLRLLVLDAAQLLRFLDEPSITPFVCLLRSFKIRSTESIVLQLRVVAGAPKKPSITPRYPIVLMWRRYTPNTSRSLEPMIRTNHFSPGGNAIGREGLPRLDFDQMLTH